MRLTEIARSDAWPGVQVEDGLRGLLAPSPVVVGEDLFVVVGRRDGTGTSSLWALHMRSDLSDAELLPMPVTGPVPAHARDGVVPTDAREAREGAVTVLYSGFRALPRGYQLLTGALRGALGDCAGWTHAPEPLLPPLPGQDVVRASATFSRARAGTLVYAAGDRWVDLGGSAHPVSGLRRKTMGSETDVGEFLLAPRENEFALTRPVELVTPQGCLLFFSRRLRDGRYLQGLARADADGELQRCDEELHFVGGGGAASMYASPFRWQGRLLAAVATSRLGEGGICLVELDQVA